MAEHTRGIIFYDGACGLCNRFVQAVLQRDLQGRFCFATLQGDTATRFLRAEDREQLSTMVVVIGAKTYRQADAVLAVAVRLGRGWPLCSVLYLVPRALRNRAYTCVARHRRRLFPVATCRLPTREEKARLLP